MTVQDHSAAEEVCVSGTVDWVSFVPGGIQHLSLQVRGCETVTLTIDATVTVDGTALPDQAALLGWLAQHGCTVAAQTDDTDSYGLASRAAFTSAASSAAAPLLALHGAGADGAGLALLESRLLARRSEEGYGFDPLTILMLLSALIPLIQACMSPAPFTLRRRFLNRARLAVAIYREAQGLTWVDSFRAADRLFDLANEATDDELNLLIRDCKSEGGGG